MTSAQQNHLKFEMQNWNAKLKMWKNNNLTIKNMNKYNNTITKQYKNNTEANTTHSFFRKKYKEIM